MKRVPVVAACAALIFHGSMFVQSAAAVGPQTDLSIAIQGSGSPVVAGSQTQYQVTTTNKGPSQAINVTTTLELPHGMTFASVAPTADCTHNDGVITCTRATLDAGGSATFTIIANTLPDARGTLLVSGITTSNIEDTSQSNNARTVSTVMQPEIDLQLTLNSVQPAPAIAGAPMTYQFTIANAGRSTASDTILDLGFSAATIDNVRGATPGVICEQASDEVICSLGVVAPAGMTQDGWLQSGSVITVEVTPKAALMPDTSLQMTAALDAAELESSISNNYRAHWSTVMRMSDLELGLVAAAPAMASGDMLTYTFIAQNLGPSNSDNVVFTATIPTALFVVSDIQGKGCTRADGTITCTPGTVVPGQQETITIQGRARAAKPASITLEATLAGASPEVQGGAINSARAITTIQPLYSYLPIVGR